MEDTLFSSQVKRPLADRLRPQSLAEVVGQDQVVGADAPLGRMVRAGKISSFILWGPPGLRQDHDCQTDRRKYEFVF